MEAITREREATGEVIEGEGKPQKTIVFAMKDGEDGLKNMREVAGKEVKGKNEGLNNLYMVKRCNLAIHRRKPPAS